MSDGASCTVELYGAVTDAEVGQVTQALAVLPPGGVLLIDASLASRLEAALLGRLVRAIREHGGRVTVRIRGLSLHDSRLLEYLGLGLDLDGSVAALDGRRPRRRAEPAADLEPDQLGRADRG